MAEFASSLCKDAGYAAVAGQIEVVVSLAISILIIYILTHLVEWFQNSVEAKRMTEELLRFQKKQEEKEVL